MIEALAAPGPHRDFAGELGLFGRLVGMWSLHIRLYGFDGSVRYEHDGSWSFGWVLDGRAIQDVLIAPNYESEAAEVGARMVGSTIRLLNPRTRAWQVVWIGATTGAVVVFDAREVGDQIWIETRDAEGTSIRWVFSGITEHSFEWRATISDDEGQTWVTVQEMSARRTRGPAARSRKTS
jgi:hypothetical protein